MTDPHAQPPTALEDSEFRRLCLTTRTDRQRLVADASRDVFLRLERQGRLGAFSEACRDAIVGAAMLLDRDPEELAELLRDGRLAWYIRNGEAPLRLELDDPDPREPIEERLRAAAEWADAERERIDRKLSAVTDELTRLAAELRERVRRIEHAPYTWAEYRDGYRRRIEFQQRRAAKRTKQTDAGAYGATPRVEADDSAAASQTGDGAAPGAAEEEEP